MCAAGVGGSAQCILEPAEDRVPRMGAEGSGSQPTGDQESGVCSGALSRPLAAG